MPGSSSYADRISRQFEQQFGRPASASDPQYAAYVQTALPQAIADDHAAYEASKRRWGIVDDLAMTGVVAGLTGGVGGAVLGGTGTAAAVTSGSGSTGAAGMTGATKLGIGQLLADTFANLWGANRQAGAARDASAASLSASNRAAELEKAALDDQLNFLKYQDTRDYNDFIAREARDRKDWEISEQRKAPFRALADSAVRTLADFIRVPGMRPAQEIPVQQWTATPQTPVSGQQPPVNSTLAMYAQRPPQSSPNDPLLASYGRRTLGDFAR